jgi:hypothetical protein
MANRRLSVRTAGVFFLALIVSTESTYAQTANPPAQAGPAVGQPSTRKTAQAAKRSLERDFFKNLLHDQEVIWTSPIRIRLSDAVWLAPLAGGTVALVSTDHATTEEGLEFSANPTHAAVSNAISDMGSAYATAGVCGAFYLFGRIDNNARSRETGLLAAEALIDAAIVGEVIKEIAQRPRPHSANEPGQFFEGGNSFPSGHSLAAFSVATVVAMEYHKHVWVGVIAYTLASMVAVSRFTGSNHFLSDILVGSAIGFGAGRYVYHSHHDPSLDETTQIKAQWPAKLIPRLTPRLGSNTQGISAMWSF